MDWYVYIAWILILTQLVFAFQMFRNYRYSLTGPRDRGTPYCLKTILIVPCKGIDNAFEENIASLFGLDYEYFLLWFVVQDKKDPAYEKLLRLIEKLAPTSKARDIQVLVAGQTSGCSQKLHNLLYAYRQTPKDIQVLAFADSDICVGKNWLTRLVRPLRKTRTGVTSGYRWFIPQENNLATLALSCTNARVAQLLGAYRYNEAWGGSMATRIETFRRLRVEQIWTNAISDDLSLSYAVKKARMVVAFVPECIVASYIKATWQDLFEFARRQFLITRVSLPGTWWFGLLSCLYSIAGLWAGTILAVYAANTASSNLSLFTAVPAVFLFSQLFQAVLRQKMASKLLKKNIPKMKYAMIVDIALFWMWSVLLLAFIISSAFGRTICWRGIKYKLLSPTKTIIVGSKKQ